MEDVSKPFLEHLEDLRQTLLRCVYTLLISMVLAFCFADQLYQLFRWPLTISGIADPPALRNLTVIGPFSMDMQVCLSAGIVAALPFMLYFVGQFVLPALTAAERRLLVPVFTAGAGLFVAGALFAFFVIIPRALGFFHAYSKSRGMQADWTIENYLDFVVNLMLAFGVGFELPVVILALAKLGIVDAALLRAHRRHAVLGIAFAAALITPTPDLLTMGCMALPMYLLYEISIIACRYVERPRREESAGRTPRATT